MRIAKNKRTTNALNIRIYLIITYLNI